MEGNHPHSHMMITAGHAAMLAESAITMYVNRVMFEKEPPIGFSSHEEYVKNWVSEAIHETARMANNHG